MTNALQLHQNQAWKQRELWDTDAPLVWFSPLDPFLIRHSFEGVQIMGATGSGKSTGSGAYLAKGMLAAGYGGLVLTSKRGEASEWLGYCKATGRQPSLMIVRPEDGDGFNFLKYELQRPGVGAGHTQNIASLFRTVMDAQDHQQGRSHTDPFWPKAADQLVRNAIDLASLARGEFDLQLMMEIVNSAPRSSEELHSQKWQATSKWFRLFEQAASRSLSERQNDDLKLTFEYWSGEFAPMAPKTRSSIVTGLTSLVDHLLRGSLAGFLGGKTTFVPELTHQGTILVIDMPVLVYREIGVIAQVLIKTMWQRATERRVVNEHTRPVFLWADEAHYFLTEEDRLFQSTARSAHAATVYLTQNLANYHSTIGGRHATAATTSLLGNLQTKIFHQNGDHETNRFAQDTFDSRERHRYSGNVSHPQQTTSMGWQQVNEPSMPSRVFSTLRKGGPDSKFEVEGIIFQGGRIWNATGKNHLKTTFRQHLD